MFGFPAAAPLRHFNHFTTLPTLNWLRISSSISSRARASSIKSLSFILASVSVVRERRDVDMVPRMERCSVPRWVEEEEEDDGEPYWNGIETEAYGFGWMVSVRSIA